MRTTVRAGIVTVAASALLAGAGAAEANDYVINDNGSALLVDASYERDGVTGFAYVWQQQNGDATAFLWEQSGGWVQCAGASTKRTADDVYGFVGTFTYGTGGGTVAVAPRYATGSATAVVTAYREDVDECNGRSAVTDLGTVSLAIDLAAAGPVTSTRTRDGYHVPSEYNDRYSLSFTGRTGAGTVDVRGLSAAATGTIAKSTWSYHANG